MRVTEGATQAHSSSLTIDESRWHGMIEELPHIALEDPTIAYAGFQGIRVRRSLRQRVILLNQDIRIFP